MGKLYSADDLLDLEPLLARVEALERTFESRVGEEVAKRFEPIEQLLVDQELAIRTLNERLDKSDDNLRRLVTILERLVDRDAAAVIAAANSPFEDHLNEALQTSDPANRNPGKRNR